MNKLRLALLLFFLIVFERGSQAAPPAGYVIEWGWSTVIRKAPPVQVVLSNAVAVSAGRLHCLALKDDGTVVRWSGNFRAHADFANELTTTYDASGGKPDRPSPHIIITNGIVKIDGRTLDNVISIAAGDGFSLALKKDGTVVTWGANYSPTGLTNITAIAAARFTSLALKNDGTVVRWESKYWPPEYGQLRQVPIGSNVSAIAIAESAQGIRGVALRKDGTVAHWGEETIYHDATPPLGLSSVVAIAVAYNHTLALKNDGTVIGWGFNKVGQATGVPTTTSPNISAGQVTNEGQVLDDIVSIAAGHGYSMALKRNGTIVTWGRMLNGIYPATAPAGLSNVVAIAAGDDFCLAITTNRAVAEKFQK